MDIYYRFIDISDDELKKRIIHPEIIYEVLAIFTHCDTCT